MHAVAEVVGFAVIELASVLEIIVIAPAMAGAGACASAMAANAGGLC